MNVKASRRQLISGPYRACPACGRDAFGLLAVARTDFVRECVECGLQRTESVPPLSKRVLYLDQFVISELAKVLDTTARSHSRVKGDAFWRELFCCLTRVVRLQLLACPSSVHHDEESSVCEDPSYGSLRDVYSHFSAGCSFEAPDTIVRYQVAPLFQAWIEGRAPGPVAIERAELIRGGLSEWEERFRIDVRFRRSRAAVEAQRQDRQQCDDALIRLVEAWRHSTRTYDETMRAEASAFGPAQLRAYLRWAARLMTPTPLVDPAEALPPPAAVLISDLRAQLEHSGVSIHEAMQHIATFLGSTYLLEVPYNKITSGLFAAIARRFQNGQRRVPEGSAFTDIRAIGSLLPYCDAMFLDKEMASLLAEEPLRSSLRPYGTTILSLRDRDGVIEYLRNIERSASPEHVALVQRMYGEDWLTPWFGMVDGVRNRRESQIK